MKNNTLLIGIVALVIVAVLAYGCQQETPPTEPAAPEQPSTAPPPEPAAPAAPAKEGTPSADKVDTIPDIELSECLTKIKETNPEMSDQDARDNCWSIEAVNQGDKSLCDKVSAGFRENCLKQFQ